MRIPSSLLLATLVVCCNCFGATESTPEVASFTVKPEMRRLTNTAFGSAWWQQGEWVELSETTGQEAADAISAEAGDPSARFRLFMDGATLYLAVKVISSEPQKDLVWIRLLANRDETVFFETRVDGDGVVEGMEFVQGGFLAQARHTTASAQVEHTADGWNLLLGMPVAELRLDPELDVWRGQVAVARKSDSAKDAVVTGAWPSASLLDDPQAFAHIDVSNLERQVFRWQFMPRSHRIVRDGSEFTLEQDFVINNETGRYRTVWIESVLRDADGGNLRRNLTPVALSGVGGRRSEKGRLVTVRLPLGNVSTVEGLLLNRIVLPSHKDEALAITATEISNSYKPARLVLVQPGYRSAIFASQKLDRIEARLEHVDRSMGIEGIRGELRAQDGTLRSASVAPLEGGAGSAPGWSVTVDDVLSVPEGDLDLVVSFDTPLGTTELVRRIRKLPYRKGEAWINERGVLHRDGEPLPVYGYVFGQWDKLRERRFPNMFMNLVMPVYLGKDNQEALMQRLDEDGIFGGRYIPSGSTTPSHNRGVLPLSDKERKDYLDFIRKIGDDPRVLLWYHLDEPELRGVGAARIREIYELFLEADPWRPVTVINSNTPSIDVYQYGADISNPDPYPVFIQNGGARSSMSKIGTHLNVIRDGVESYRSRWATLQAFNYNYYGREGNRGPTAREMRSQQVIALIHGATGFTWYPEYLVWDEPGVRASLPYLSNEYLLLFPFIADKRPEVLTVQNGLEAGLLTRGDEMILMLANPEWKQGTFTIYDERFASVPQWRKLGQGGSIAGGSPTLSVTLEPHESVILVSPAFEVPAQLDWESVEAEEQKILAAAFESDNIAHYLNGAVVRLAPANAKRRYSPMPIVIDGISDPRGRGWEQAFKAGTGVEITFAAAAHPRRMLICASNLLEADIQSHGANGWSSIARLDAKSVGDVHEVSLPGIATDKIRVLAQKVRRGDNFINIGDIKIYE